jgi:hypothetical protein
LGGSPEAECRVADYSKRDVVFLAVAIAVICLLACIVMFAN